MDSAREKRKRVLALEAELLRICVRMVCDSDISVRAIDCLVIE